MRAVWRVYGRLFVAQAQLFAQYRVQSVLWMLFAVIRPLVFLAAWAAAAEAQGGAIGDFTVGDFAAYYVCLTLVSQLTTAWIAESFEFEIRTGQLSAKLLRPLHPMHYSVVENAVYKLTTLPVLLPVLVLIAWTFNARFQTQPWHVVAFVPSLLLAAALRFVFNWCFATLGFWTTRVHSVTQVNERMVFVFSGMIAPLSLLPGPLALVGYVLPFGYMLWEPSEILRGATSVEQALLLITGQAVWLVVTAVVFRALWRVGLRRFSAVGA
jgi:ABC-2 type transport system permease protein